MILNQSAMIALTFVLSLLTILVASENDDLGSHH
jgi:hypothetical protein